MGCAGQGYAMNPSLVFGIKPGAKNWLGIVLENLNESLADQGQGHK